MVNSGITKKKNRIHKIMLYILIAAFSISLTNALVANKTEFDDGSADFNITANTTKFISLPINSSILQANLSVTVSSQKTAFLNSTYFNHNLTKEISAGSGDTGFGNQNDSDYDTAWILSDLENTLLMESIEVYNLSQFNKLYSNGSYEVKYNLSVNEYNGSTLRSSIDISCFSEEIHSKGIQASSSNTSAKNLTSITNHTIPQTCIDQAIANNDQLEITTQITTTKASGALHETQLFLDRNVSRNFLIRVNNTVVFNETNYITGTNKTDLNTNNALEDCNEFEDKCSVDFEGDIAANRIFDIYIEYNKTNAAIINIVSPVQITKTITSGDSFTEAINISNTGDWNATNLTFQTISGLSTPNYNDSITHDCGGVNLANGSSVTCNVTFNSITQEPESDEKLKACSIGSDNDDQVCSNSIDVDVTVNAATSSGGQSGGSSFVSDDDTPAQFRIVGANSFNEETNQLGIRPGTEREHCLDVVNDATETQIISIECITPELADRDACSWVTLDKQKVTVQPSPELRETVCLTINPPIDLLINEKHVINIKGTVTAPSGLLGTSQTHPITLQVFSGSLILQLIFNKLTDTSLSDQIFLFIQKFIKSDVKILNIPNVLNPIFYLPFLLFFLLIDTFKVKIPFIIKFVFLTILTGAIIYSLFNLVILFYITLILSFIVVSIRFTRLITRISG